MADAQEERIGKGRECGGDQKAESGNAGKQPRMTRGGRCLGATAAAATMAETASTSQGLRGARN